MKKNWYIFRDLWIVYAFFKKIFEYNLYKILKFKKNYNELITRVYI